MARKSGPNEQGDSKDKYKVRAHDGLELLKLILDENPALKQRVLWYMERALGKDKKK